MMPEQPVEQAGTDHRAIDERADASRRAGSVARCQQDLRERRQKADTGQKE